MGKIATFGETARKIVSGLRFNYLKEDDSVLGKVDFGVLTVAMMVAALDGTILPEELAAFRKLARECRVGDGEQTAFYEQALHSAGYVLLMSRSGLSEKALTQVFLREAEKVLPMGFAGGKGEDIRRALVIWITMGLSDGRFSGIERTCIRAFCSRVAEIMQKRRKGMQEKLWFGFCFETPLAGNGKARPVKNPEAAASAADWMTRAEALSVAGDLAAIRRFIVRG